MGIGLFTVGALVLLAGLAVMVVVAVVAIWILRRRPVRPGPEEGAGAGNPGSGTWLASDFGDGAPTHGHHGQHGGDSSDCGGTGDCGGGDGGGGGGGSD